MKQLTFTEMTDLLQFIKFMKQKHRGTISNSTSSLGMKAMLLLYLSTQRKGDTNKRQNAYIVL